MSEITGNVAAKGCQATGITTPMLDSAYDQLVNSGNGVKKIMAIVELVPDTYSGKTGGKRKVGYSILSLEPATTPEGEDHLRQFQRAQWAIRNRDTEQLAIDATLDDLEPKVEDVLRNRAHMHHDYVPADLDDPTIDQCELCGDAASALLHRTPPGDPFAAVSDDAGEDPEPEGEDE